MKKKLTAILLASALTGALLAGCGSAAGTAPATDTSQTTESTDAAVSTADSGAVTDAAPVADTVAVTDAAPVAETGAEMAAAADTGAQAAKTDEELAKECSALIEALNVQMRTETTDADIAAAKAAWDALTDEQKAMVEDPDYFGRDTGDASLDAPLNEDEIGENELLVVSFGTSFNDSRATDIGGIEKALQEAYPDWSVRRGFTAQIIINHVQARDGEVIDNVDQALARAKENGVKNLLIQPTHLMHGSEYDELMEAVTAAAGDFETVRVAEPLLGEVGEDATVINDDKETVAKAVAAEAVKAAGFDSIDAAAEDGTAYVFMGHGTAHVAKVTYSQMQTQMDKLGYKNVFIGTVEGEPEETSCENIIAAVKDAGYKKVVLRPLMVVAGDHANNDMAGDDEDSWKSMFTADGSFEKVDVQIEGLGRIPEVQALYVEHAGDAMKADPIAADTDKTEDELAKECSALIEALNVQKRTDTTDADIASAKAAWDALTDEQKAMVEDPDYFGRDTGDAKLDDPLNEDEIGENELLVVSFGTSFNDSRVTDIGGIEKALQEAYPDWSVRRGFTAQIIINHVQARDGEVIDNVDQALARAKENGVKNLVIQPTHLMHGAEYDELMEAVKAVEGDFESVKVAEPLLGEVGDDATVINDDKETVAKAVAAEAAKAAGFDSIDAAAEDGTAFVFMGHGTAHVAKVTYSQMQTQMDKLGYKNVFIGTVEGEPEETSCENIIAAVKDAGYKKVILRPLMVVAGDHANNDMAGDDEDSWKSMFTADGSFEKIDTQIEGLGRIPEVQALYVEHSGEAIGGEAKAEEGSTSAAAEEGAALEDGTYTATFITDSSMFHVNEANEDKGTLTVKDGQMTIHVSLVSKKILNLFPGTAEEAQKEGAALLQPTTDKVEYSDGTTDEVFGFDIPVPAIDQEFDCALVGEKGKWFDHKVKVTHVVKE